MRAQSLLNVLVMVTLSCQIIAGDQQPETADVNSKPFGLGDRDPWTTSRFVGTPEPPPPYTVRRAFPNLTFENPVCIAQEPGTDRFMVAENSGRIYAFTKDTADADSRELFLDTGRNLYAFSFHPNYEQNGFVFTHSPNGKQPDEIKPGDRPVLSTNNGNSGDSTENNKSDNDKFESTDSVAEHPEQEIENRGTQGSQPEELAPHRRSRVSRYQAVGTTSRRCLPESEKIIIEWPSGGHNGGEAIIGPDGYLYVSTGDGTSGSDQKKTGQGVNDLLAVIMRLDVDHPAEGKAYSIPPDNPFINYPGARPEIWAFGFRNPWRMSFDSKTGALWVGDVGQDLWEMIWLVQRGGNYGWSVQEGSHPFHPNQQIGPGPILPPVVEHHHVECRSITGGYVYYGEKFPELNGTYFYGDYQYGMLWGVRFDGRQVTDHEVLASTPLQVSSFGMSRTGEIYMLDYLTSSIYELTRAVHAVESTRFPRKLSETGLFASVGNHQMASGIIGYSVNTPQWIDGATKERFIAIPGDTKIGFVEKSKDAQTWIFPNGAVNVETISLEMESGNPASKRRLETRVMIKQPEKEEFWLGYSYLWNDQQTDATLVDANGKDIPLTIIDSLASGGKRRQTWHIPSRNECMVCHSRAAGFVLGPRTVQMNRDHDYPDATDNQLRTLNHIGLFAEPLNKSPQKFEAIPDAYDPTADLDARARAYLHVNCAGCHVADGGGNAKMDMKYHQTLEDTGFTTAAMHGTFGLSGARIVVPGDPYASVLFYRLAKWGRGRMPHTGSNLHDEQGLDLIHNWITNLPDISNDAKRTAANRPPTVEEPDAEETIRQQVKNELIRLDRIKNSAARRNTVEVEMRSMTAQLRRAEQLAADQQAEEIAELLSSSRTALKLARLVQQQSMSDGVRQQVIAQGAAHSDTNVRDLFERFLPENKRVRRLGNMIDAAEILALTGDAAHGRHFFFTATALQCTHCHQLEEKGGTLGPDLSHIGRKYKRHEILEELIAPSRRIDPKYRTHVLVTSQGKSYTGILAEKSEQSVVLKILRDGKSVEVRVAAEDVDELVPQQTSLMPDGMLRDLTPQQAADLLAFLASLNQPSAE
ncbi:MAG: PQQ-dependent sugar dehydrogenase [Fuerstiella sp.]|nr:PQQ-dependent sugar dehydrogenase [Fuerstiella sp.]